MNSAPFKSPLYAAYQLAIEFLDSLDTSPVGAPGSYEQLYELWQDQLPEVGTDPGTIVSEMHQATLPGLNLNQSGRFFAWVIGGSHPAALAADWLTSTYDQNAGLFAVAPSASIVEEIAGKWMIELLNLPKHTSFAFVTGCQMAHFTCLCAARNHLFHEAGWDIEAKGFYGAPVIRIICSDQKHVTVNRALRMLGFGTDSMILIPTNDAGEINADALEKELMRDTKIPTLVLLQAGDLNTGAYDDFETIIPMAHKVNAWVHVDGAFGLWASASPELAHLTRGIERADSWATDGHKWLNVPYDCGYAFTAHPEAHRRSMAQHASYVTHDKKARDQMDWTPEFSRRARGFATYAVIRELGTKGIVDLINRTSKHAYNIVTRIGELDHTEIVAVPVINQGLVRFLDPNAKDEKDHDNFTEHVIREVNKSGEAFFQPTTYKGKRCMRVSVSGWATNEKDVDRTVEAVRKALFVSL